MLRCEAIRIRLFRALSGRAETSASSRVRAISPPDDVSRARLPAVSLCDVPPPEISASPSAQMTSAALSVQLILKTEPLAVTSTFGADTFISAALSSLTAAAPDSTSASKDLSSLLRVTVTAESGSVYMYLSLPSVIRAEPPDIVFMQSPLSSRIPCLALICPPLRSTMTLP